MVANPGRRVAVTDAALELLGRGGARAVTHRAVDVEAQVPIGTTANYFSSRADLLAGMAQRIFTAWEPDPDRLEALAKVRLEDAVPEYAAYVAERVLERPNLARALIELRLEASRNPEIAEPLVTFLRAGFADDVRFHAQRGLSGGAETVLALHHLVNGVILDATTIRLDPSADPIEEARITARQLMESSKQ